MSTHLEKRVTRTREKLARESYDTLIVSCPENRRYLSGFTADDTRLDESPGALFITHDKLLLATDARFTIQARREAPLFEIFTYPQGLPKSLPEILRMLGARAAGFEPACTSVQSLGAMRTELAEAKVDIQLVPAAGLVEPLRAVKDKEELETIRRALSLAELVFETLLEETRPGVTEEALAWSLEKSLREAGAEALSFPSIVAAGPNSAMAHAVPSDREVREGEPLLFDWGARLSGYCSDISRTLVFGKPDATWEKVYATVLRAQKRAMEEIRPGKTGGEIDAVARDIIAQAGYGEFFGHGLGHGAGLAVHEEPRLGQGRKTVLEPGMVVTVEPGIYLPDWGGVRVENMVVVTEDGCEVLNTLPEDILEIMA